MFCCTTPFAAIVGLYHHSADTFTQAVITAIKILSVLDCLLSKIDITLTLRISTVVYHFKWPRYFAHFSHHPS